LNRELEADANGRESRQDVGREKAQNLQKGMGSGDEQATERSENWPRENAKIAKGKNGRTDRGLRIEFKGAQKCKRTQKGDGFLSETWGRPFMALRRVSK
jgi:hypothetical protein